MVGRMLSGTDKSPDQTFVKNGKKFKVIRRMGFLGAHLGRDAKQKWATVIFLTESQKR